MPTLSVAMIVKNEATCLAQCLESVRGIANEIVVGDTGSSDGTPDLARSFGARVFDVYWDNDFAAARNRVLKTATGDWVLHLDADEVLAPDGAREVRRLVDEDGRGADAVELILANYADEPRAWRWTPVSPDDPMARGYSGYIRAPLLRLFRNHRGFEYREPVHENITESVREKGGVVHEAPIVIHHYGYRANRPGDNKGRLYLEIARHKLAKRPDDAKAWHDCAEQLLAVGHANEAETHCRRALALDQSYLPAVMTLANILCNRGSLDDARRLLEGAVRAGGVVPHMHVTLGAIAIREGQTDRALHHIEAALRLDENHVLALLHHARILDLVGDGDTARRQLQYAASLAPRLTEVVNRLQAHEHRCRAVELNQDGRSKEALALLVQALRLDPEDPLIHGALGDVLMAIGDVQRARQSYERASRLAPNLRRFF